MNCLIDSPAHGGGGGRQHNPGREEHTMLRVGQNTDRQEKRPQNRQAEWQERDALQASPRASWALASLSLDSLHRFDHQCGGPISTHHKCGKPKTSFGFPHNPPFLGVKGGGLGAVKGSEWGACLPKDELRSPCPTPTVVRIGLTDPAKLERGGQL